MFFTLYNILKSIFPFMGSYSINVFPDPLSKEEEQKALQETFLGNKDSRNKLIEHNLRLVAHIVKKFDYKNIDQDDLISIGTIGLIKGIDTYKESKNTRLTTYCARCIENEILMYFRSNNKNNKNISINEPISYDKEGNEITILDVLKTPKPDYIEDINTKDNIKVLEEYMKILTPREKEVLIKRYGLYNNREYTQKEIAKNLHISRSYVSRIEKRALTKILRQYIKNNKSD